MPDNPSLMMHFTFDHEDGATKHHCSKLFGSGKCTEKVQFEKHKRVYKVTVTVNGKLRCEFCNHCSSFGCSHRHTIVCNRQNVCITDFYIRNSKSYNCGSMGGKIERKFTDHSLPLFRGSYETSEAMIEDFNATINDDSMLRRDLPCFFSEEKNVELKGSDPKAFVNSSCHQCKKHWIMFGLSLGSIFQLRKTGHCSLRK